MSTRVMKVLQDLVTNVLRFLVPFGICLITFFVWLNVFSVFRNSFADPFGNDGSPTFPDSRELLIYNGVQFIFLAILFVACAYIYSRFIKHIEGPTWKVLLTIGISWALWTFVTYGLATFFCCPGLFPDAFNKFYWLTLPEFILLGMLGGAYLGKKIVYR